MVHTGRPSGWSCTGSTPSKLLESGHVYKCYCTKEEEDADRREAQAAGRPYQYKGRCPDLTPEQQAAFEAEGRKPVLRFRVPKGEVIGYNDLIRGPIEFPTDSIGDFIIMRANGMPLYNFAVVIDDVTMKITHILRGEGHISNTPVQLLIYRALGFPVPEIGHLGHMTNPEGGKLSKRKGDAAIRDYREQGYLPEAMLNFMSLLGWTPPGAESGREFLTKDELIRDFDLGRVTKASSVFDRNKLNWMNGVYIRKKSLDEFAELALPFVVKSGLYTEEKARANWDWFKEVMAQVHERVETLAEVPEHVDIFLKDEIEVDEKAAKKFLTDSGEAVLPAGQRRAAHGGVDHSGHREACALHPGGNGPEAEGELPADPGRHYRPHREPGPVRDHLSHRPGAGAGAHGAVLLATGPCVACGDAVHDAGGSCIYSGRRTASARFIHVRPAWALTWR